MHSLYVDDQIESAKGALSWQITRCLYLHQYRGKIVIVTNKPAAMLAAVKKQWHKLIRLVQRERSATLDASRIFELTSQITFMQTLGFSVEGTDQPTLITFNTPEYLLRYPTDCRTLYITVEIDKETAYLITAFMPRHGLVVLYSRLIG
jgi:hypothetical protein